MLTMIRVSDASPLYVENAVQWEVLERGMADRSPFGPGDRYVSVGRHAP